MAFRDKAAQDLAKEDAKKSEEVLSNIQAFLKSYNAGDKYDMVIGYSKGGNVFYGSMRLFKVSIKIIVGRFTGKENYAVLIACSLGY